MQKAAKSNQATHSEHEISKVHQVLLTELNKSLDKLESLYDLDKPFKQDGLNRKRLIKQLDVVQLNEIFLEERKSISKMAKRKRTLKVAAQMGVVSYLMNVIQFRDIQLDIALHPHINSLYNVLQHYIHYNNELLKTKQELNIILDALRSSESISKMRKNRDIIFRLLRLFYLLVLFDDYLNASIIALFLLNHVISSNNTNNNNYSNRRRSYNEFSRFNRGFR